MTHRRYVEKRQVTDLLASAYSPFESVDPAADQPGTLWEDG